VNLKKLVVSKKNVTDLIEKLNKVKNQMPNLVRRKKEKLQ